MSKGDVAITILAAGASRRMGRPKQLLMYEGTTLLRRAANIAVDTGCGPVIVVVGEHAELMDDELLGLDLEAIRNEEWRNGMSSSIRCGVSAVQTRCEIAALLFMVCDQPLVSAGLLREMIALHRTGQAIVACRYADTIGVPALFARDYWDELLTLRGDRGAKAIIEVHRDRAEIVEFPGGERDIDTLADEIH